MQRNGSKVEDDRSKTTGFLKMGKPSWLFGMYNILNWVNQCCVGGMYIIYITMGKSSGLFVMYNILKWAIECSVGGMYILYIKMGKSGELFGMYNILKWANPVDVYIIH